MINFLLKYPFSYKTYQNIIRGKYNEFNFLQYVFNNLSSEKPKVLDIYCGVKH